jgi:hypothetical protein
MTEEEYRRAIMLPAPKPSLEDRVEYLEADGSAQRTAIIRLERVVELIFKSLLAIFMVCAALALAVLT